MVTQPAATSASALLFKSLFKRQFHRMVNVVDLLAKLHLSGGSSVSSADEAQKEHDMLQKIMQHRDVNCKDVGDNLKSVNFADRAFYKASWDDLSIQARGLFVEQTRNKAANRPLFRVCGRSYRKFFYQDERGVGYMKRENLPKIIRFPMTAYVKANGYLGILFARRDASGKAYLQPASKSTIHGDFATNFSQMLRHHLSENNLSADELAEFLASANVSVVFEVIHPTFDPHIIRYKQPQLILLECIHNQISTFETLPFDALSDFARNFRFDLKVRIGAVPDLTAYDALHDKLTQDENFRVNGELVEGLVLEDEQGFMVKAKSIYYNNWKRARSLKDILKRGKPLRLSNEHPTVSAFMQWLLKPERRQLWEKDIITLRSMYLGEELTETGPTSSARVNSDEEEGPSQQNEQSEPGAVVTAELPSLRDKMIASSSAIVVIAPPFAGQEKLAARIATAIQGVLVELDKNIKTQLTAAYYSGNPIVLYANEVVLNKFWAGVQAASESIQLNWIGVIYEPSDELPLLCIKNFITSLSEAPDEKDSAKKADKQKAQMHRAILRSCLRISDALSRGADQPRSTSQDSFESWLNENLDGFVVKLQILPSSLKEISEDTIAAINTANHADKIEIRDSLTEEVLSFDEQLSQVASGTLSLIEANEQTKQNAVEQVDSNRQPYLIQLAREAVFHGRAPSITTLRSEAEQKFLMWLTVAGFRQNNYLQKPSQEIYQDYQQAKQPPLKPENPLMILLVGLPGSLLARILSRAFGIPRVCQDEEGNRQKFLTAVLQQLKRAGIVFADRNNHTAFHRKAVIEAVKKKMPSVTVIIVSMKVDDQSPEVTVTLCHDRIISRGENHPSLRASSDFGTVLSQFSRSYESPVFADRNVPAASSWSVPRSPEDWDFVAERVIEVDPFQDLDQKLFLLVDELRQLSQSTRLPILNNPDATKQAVIASINAIAQEDGLPLKAAVAAVAAAAAPSTSPTSSPPGNKTRPPAYYAFQINGDHVQLIIDTVNRLVGPNTLDKYQNLQPLTNNGAPHVTLLFMGSYGKRPALSDFDESLLERIKKNIGFTTKLQVTHVLFNEKGICMATSIPGLYQDEKRSNQTQKHPNVPTYHITLAVSGVPAKYSNDMLDSYFFTDTNAEQVKAIKIDPPIVLQGTLQEMWS